MNYISHFYLKKQARFSWDTLNQRTISALDWAGRDSSGKPYIQSDWLQRQFFDEAKLNQEVDKMLWQYQNMPKVLERQVLQSWERQLKQKGLSPEDIQRELSSPNAKKVLRSVVQQEFEKVKEHIYKDKNIPEIFWKNTPITEAGGYVSQAEQEMLKSNLIGTSAAQKVKSLKSLQKNMANAVLTSPLLAVGGTIGLLGKGVSTGAKAIAGTKMLRNTVLIADATALVNKTKNIAGLVPKVFGNVPYLSATGRNLTMLGGQEAGEGVVNHAANTFGFNPGIPLTADRMSGWSAGKGLASKLMGAGTFLGSNVVLSGMNGLTRHYNEGYRDAYGLNSDDPVKQREGRAVFDKYIDSQGTPFKSVNHAIALGKEMFRSMPVGSLAQSGEQMVAPGSTYLATGDAYAKSPFENSMTQQDFSFRVRNGKQHLSELGKKINTPKAGEAGEEGYSKWLPLVGLAAAGLAVL